MNSCKAFLCHCRFLELLSSSKCFPWRCPFKLGNGSKSHGARSGGIGWVRQYLESAASQSYLRSGQVRVFNVHIHSKLLWCTPVTGTGTGLRWFLSRTGKKGGGGTACTDGYKGVQAVRPESVAGYLCNQYRMSSCIVMKQQGVVKTHNISS